jgi:drug/metabolite transporter (DMT)-like permease
VDVTLSQALYYRSLRLLPISFHAIVLTVSPVITVLWSPLLFSERPSLVSCRWPTGVSRPSLAGSR